MAANPDFAPAPPAPAWRQKLSSFWRWWTDELGQVVPERFAAFRGAARVPLLAIEGEEVALVEPRPDGGADARASIAALDPQRRRNAVQSLLQRAGESRSRARLCLGHGEALVRRVNMPAATEENLSQVLAFEMDRLTPFRAEDVYFDHRVVSRDAAAGTIGVLVALARRELVDARLQTLRSLGVSVQGVAVRDDAAQGSSALDLLPPEQRGERETPRERLVKRALVGLVVVLLLAALAVPLWQKRELVISLQPVEAKAQAEAQAADALARELERQVSDYNFLLARKHGAPSPLAYLEDVSRLLPDNTWLNQFELKTAGKTREVQISGETASSSRLIEILEQSRLLQNATPRGSFTRGSVPGTERFMIAAEARGRAQPEPVRMSELPAQAPAASRPAPEAAKADASKAAKAEASKAAPAAAAKVETATPSKPPLVMPYVPPPGTSGSGR